MNPQDEREMRLAEALSPDDADLEVSLDRCEASELESLQQTLDFLAEHRETAPEAPNLDAFWDDFEAVDTRRSLLPLWYLAAAVLLASIAGIFWQRTDTTTSAPLVTDTPLPAKTPQFTSAEQFGRKSQMLLLAISNRDVNFAAAGADPSASYQWEYEQKHAAKLAREANSLLETAALTDREMSLVHAIGALMLQISNLQPARPEQLKVIQDALENQDLLFKIDFFILKRTMQV
jgi:hypothetical protein